MKFFIYTFMKYINTFEKFKFPFWKKDKPVSEIPIGFSGGYEYNGKYYLLKIGDYTNKGYVKDFIQGMHETVLTDDGEFLPQELTIFKGNKKDIEIFLDLKKYNL